MIFIRPKYTISMCESTVKFGARMFSIFLCASLIVNSAAVPAFSSRSGVSCPSVFSGPAFLVQALASPDTCFPDHAQMKHRAFIGALVSLGPIVQHFWNPAQGGTESPVHLAAMGGDGLILAAVLVTALAIYVIDRRYRRASKVQRDELAALQRLDRRERRQNNAREQKLSAQLARTKRQTFILEGGIIFAGLMGVVVWKYAVSPQKGPTPTPNGIVISVPKSPRPARPVIAPIPESMKNNNDFVRRKIQEVMKAFNNFDEELKGIDLPAGFTREEVVAAPQVFNQFVATAKFSNQAEPGQTIGISSSQHVFVYNPADLNYFLQNDPDSTLIHEMTHLLKRQTDRDAAELSALPILFEFLKTHPDASAIKKYVAEGRKSVTFDELVAKSEWDVDALRLDPQAYEAARVIFQKHWLDETEADALEIAYIVRKARMEGLNLEPYVKSLRLPDYRIEKIRTMQAEYQPGVMTPGLIEAGLNEVFHSQLQTDIFVALRRAVEPGFTKEKMRARSGRESDPAFQRYSRELLSWARREILRMPEKIGFNFERGLWRFRSFRYAA